MLAIEREMRRRRRRKIEYEDKDELDKKELDKTSIRTGGRRMEMIQKGCTKVREEGRSGREEKTENTSWSRW